MLPTDPHGRRPEGEANVTGPTPLGGLEDHPLGCGARCKRHSILLSDAGGYRSRRQILCRRVPVQG